MLAGTPTTSDEARMARPVGEPAQLARLLEGARRLVQQRLPVPAYEATQAALAAPLEGAGGSCEALRLQALALYLAGEFGQALQCAHDAVARARTGTDAVALVRSLNTLGTMLSEAQQTPEATELLFEAERLARPLGSQGELVIARNNLAHFHWQKGAALLESADHAAEARQHLRAGLALVADLDEADVGGTLGGLPELYDTRIRLLLALDERAAAAEQIGRLLCHARRSGDLAAKACAMDHMATFCERAGRVESAIRFSARAARAWGRTAQPQRRIASLESLAERYAGCGRDEQAYRTAEQALDESDRFQRAQAKARAAIASLALDVERERERTRSALVHTGKMLAVGRLASGVVHDMSHPVGAIALLADSARQLAEEGRLDGLADLHQRIAAEAKRLHGLIRRLRDFARSDSSHIGTMKLDDVLADASQLFKPRLESRRIRYTQDAAGVVVEADSERLSLAITNVILNAADALTSSAQPQIAVRAWIAADGAYLSIRDNGPGLSAEAQARLFEPFFTTKPAGEGLGLGLALSAQSLASMNATLKGGNHSEGGAEFVFHFPAR